MEQFKWYDLDEAKLVLTFNNRVTVQVGMYVKEDTITSHIEEVYPMVNISDSTNFSIALNMSNAFMLSTVLSTYTENETITEYFNKTNLSNGWYVAQKYVDKVVYNKVLTDKITLRLVPISNEKKVPMYKIRFTKNNNNSIEMDLTRAEIKSLVVLLSMFSANASIYSFIFRQKMQYRYVENQLKTLESTNSILRSILDKLTNSANNTVLPEVPDKIKVPEIDFTNTSNKVNNIDIKPKKKKKVAVNDELDIDSIDLGNDTDERFKELVQKNTGVKVDDKDSFDSIDIKRLIPCDGGDDNVIEPVMNRSVIDVKNYITAVNKKEETGDSVTKFLAKKLNIDRRTKNQSLVYAIAKKGLVDPKVLPTLINHRGMIGTPVTSVIYSASLFASAYKYLDNHKESTIEDVSVLVYKALQMSQVESVDSFGNNEELKAYSNSFVNMMVKMVLPKNMSITGIRTLDKYISLNHSEEEVFYNYSKLNVEISEDNKYLTSALTDIYFLLWYGENKYIKDTKLSNPSGYLMDVANVPMYEFARSMLINLVVNRNDDTPVKAMVKHILDFSDMVTYASSWDKETYREAYVVLYAFYYKVIGMIKNNEAIYEGMPCFN